ncbi:MAG: photosynthetic complex putative assembly protein PuhB [Pseudomonadota bacterium]
MDLTATGNAPGDLQPRSVAAHAKGQVPEAAVEAIFRRAADEEVLWRGKPEFFRLAASAFHTNSVAVYFAVLAVIAFVSDGWASALTVAVMGLAAVLVLMAIAFFCARNSAYVITNHRLVMLIGIAVEKRISVPLKHVQSANLRMRSKGHGDIAFELKADHRLGYLLLWPHVRPLRLGRPQPLLRAVPEAETLAAMIAEACAKFSPIERPAKAATQASSQAGQPDLGGATA